MDDICKELKKESDRQHAQRDRFYEEYVDLLYSALKAMKKDDARYLLRFCFLFEYFYGRSVETDSIPFALEISYRNSKLLDLVKQYCDVVMNGG